MFFKVFLRIFCWSCGREVVVSVVLFCWFFKHFRVKPIKVSKELNLKLIKFGAPLLLTELSFLLMSYADRYLIVAYLGEEALGLYSVGYIWRCILATLLLFHYPMPLFQSMSSFMAQRKRENGGLSKESLQYLLMVIIPMWFGYVAISRIFSSPLLQRNTPWRPGFLRWFFLPTFFWA